MTFYFLWITDITCYYKQISWFEFSTILVSSIFRRFRSDGSDLFVAEDELGLPGAMLSTNEEEARVAAQDVVDERLGRGVEDYILLQHSIERRRIQNE